MRKLVSYTGLNYLNADMEFYYLFLILLAFFLLVGTVFLLKDNLIL
jgi:hypothetical protein